MSSSSELAWLASDPLSELSKIKLDLIASGKDLCDLGMINPDLAPPRLLIDKLLEATVRGSAHRYAASRGIRKLREAVQTKYQRRFGVDVDAESEICITLGTKDAILHLLMSLGARGTAVLIGHPSYPAHVSAVRASGMIPKAFSLAGDEAQILNSIASGLEDASVSTIILNFPNNPTGQTVSADFYQRLGQIVERRPVTVINDFVYGELGFGGRQPVSMLTDSRLRNCGAEIYSMSKAYSVPGWRVGATVGAEKLVSTLSKLKGHIDYGLFLPLQVAAAAGLQASPEIIRTIVQAYEHRADVVVKGLRRLGFLVAVPSAGCAVWAQLPEELRAAGSYLFARDLLLNERIGLTPGEYFGEEFRDFIRVALVAPEDKLRVVLSGIERTIQSRLSKSQPARDVAA